MGVNRLHHWKTLFLLLSIITFLCLFAYVVKYSRTANQNSLLTQVAHKNNADHESGASREDDEEAEQNEEEEEIKKSGAELHDDAINVVMTFAKAKSNVQLNKKFRICISSMLQKANSVDNKQIHLHIIGDKDSLAIGKRIVDKEASLTNHSIRIFLHDAAKVTLLTDSIVGPLKKYFVYKPGAYYSDSLFFFSIAMYIALPRLKRVVVLDVDLKFEADVAELYSFFDRFDEKQLIGIANEQQPVYRHVFHSYRKANLDTIVGDPPPYGFPGFNSAVVLMDLDRIRSSETYARLVRVDVLDELVAKYQFQGHLGDQDYFTLIGTEYRELFFTLPCSWNRQLCKWWQNHGYKSVFEKYNDCDGRVKILHGNCNTPIPEV